MEHLLATPIAYVGVFILGALFGSFANVCIYRLPSDEPPKSGFFANLIDGLRTISSPPSHCFACQKPVAWYDNVPLLSFIWLRGRCRWCEAEFSPRYLLVEAATAMLFVAVYELSLNLIYVEQPLDVQLTRAGIYMLFAFTLVVITFIDLDTFLILDIVTYPAVVVFYGLAQLLPENHWSEGLIGAAVGYLVVWLIAHGYGLLRGDFGFDADRDEGALVIAELDEETPAAAAGLQVGDRIVAIDGVELTAEPEAAAVLLDTRRIRRGQRIELTIARLDEPVELRAAGRLGMGLGDGKLLAVVGALMGWKAVVFSLFGGAVIGLVVTLPLLLLERLRARGEYLGHAEIPFGPWLAAAAAVFLFLEPWLEIQIAPFI